MQRFACWTQQDAGGLEREILPTEAPHFPGPGDGGRAIALHRCPLCSRLWAIRNGGRKLGDPQRSGVELMAQFEPEIPGPLRHHLLALLSPGRVGAPAVGIDFPIFIRACRLKGATMQIQLNDESLGEGVLREGGEEEFMDDTCACDANGTLLLDDWMRCHHHAAAHAFGSYGHLWAVARSGLSRRCWN